MNRRIAWRALFGVGLFLLLGGPTPGAVGSCGGDDLDQPADLRAYCTEREELTCVRRSLRRQITPEKSDECRREVIALCKTRAWAPQCRPTKRKARACLNALRSLDTVETPEDQIDECRTTSLCSLRPSAPTTLGGDGDTGDGDTGDDDTGDDTSGDTGDDAGAER